MKPIFVRDLQLAIRGGAGLGLSLAFFVLVAFLVPFGVGPDPVKLSSVAPGILWVAAILACLLSLDRVFQPDFEDGSLAILATSSVPFEAIAMVKTLTHWMTTGVPLALLTPLVAVLLNLPGSAIAMSVCSIFIGSLGLSAIGIFGAALTVKLRRGGLLLSLLVLPLFIPSLIFGADIVRKSAAGLDATTPFLLLGAITLLAFSLLPFATATVLKMQLR